MGDTRQNAFIDGPLGPIYAKTALPIIFVPLLSWGPPAPTPILLLDAFGWLSGIVAVSVFIARQRFLRLPGAAQAAWAIILWIFHVAAFVIVVLASI